MVCDLILDEEMNVYHMETISMMGEGVPNLFQFLESQKNELTKEVRELIKMNYC